MSYNSDNDNYSPELDSAFIVDESRRRPRPEAQSSQLQNPVGRQQQSGQKSAQQGQPRRPQQHSGQRPTQQGQPRRPQSQGGQPRRQGPQNPLPEEEYYERPVRKTRIYDPDQAVSDEQFLESYEEERVDRKRRSGGGNGKGKGPSGRGGADLEDDTRRPSNKKGRKKKKKHRVLKIILLVLLVLVLLFGFAIWNITRKFDHIDTAVSKRSDSMKHDVINILLVGEDARDGQEGQRTDTIILFSINRKKNTTTMTSIMRDTYVNIPGYGGNRINAAYAYGGLDLLDQTIEENFGITIDGNAIVNFDGFLEAMAAVGSLEIDLTAEEAQYMNENPALGSNNDESDEVWNLTEGVNELTPSQILCYSRMRYVGNSDWDRTERQRKVIAAVAGQVKHGHFINGYKVASKAAPYIKTDLKTGGMMKLAWGMIFGKEQDTHLIPVEGTYYPDNINGMAVLVPDIEANKSYLQKYINGEE